MSASLVVDLGATTLSYPSLTAAPAVESGLFPGLSGVVVGGIVNLNNANTYCNVYVGGTPAINSGILSIRVQTSNATTSGSFTDPTSGLPTFPTSFASGGNLILGSGAAGATGLWGVAVSGQNMNSGFLAFAAFQRDKQYARLIFNSGFYLGSLQAGFVSQLRTVGSGGGFTLAPSSGVVNV